MLRRLGEAAYAANLFLDNFDGIADPAGLLRKNIEELRDYNENTIKPRGDDLMYPPLCGALEELAGLYENLLN